MLCIQEYAVKKRNFKLVGSNRNKGGGSDSRTNYYIIPSTIAYSTEF